MKQKSKIILCSVVALTLSQYKEYKLLEKRLGETARMTIAPIVKYNPADYKALEDLQTECCH